MVFVKLQLTYAPWKTTVRGQRPNWLNSHHLQSLCTQIQQSLACINSHISSKSTKTEGADIQTSVNQSMAMRWSDSYPTPPANRQSITTHKRWSNSAPNCLRCHRMSTLQRSCLRYQDTKCLQLSCGRTAMVKAKFQMKLSVLVINFKSQALWPLSTLIRNFNTHMVANIWSL